MCADSERRRDRRLDLNLEVEFAPRKFHDSSLPCTGRTCNVSAGGVYFESLAAASVSDGMDIVLKIALPIRGEGAPEPLALRCEGKVVRVCRLPGPEDERLGIAVQFNNRPNVIVQSLTDSWDAG